MTREIILKPIRENKNDIDKLSEVIIRLFKQHIYLPLLRELGGSNTIKNSVDDLRHAIAQGLIRYDDYGFSGNFTAAISRELRSLGGKWENPTKRWLLPIHKIPMDIQTLISTSRDKETRLKSALLSKIDAMKPSDISKKLNVASLFKEVMSNTERDFKASVKGVAIAPKMSGTAKKRIAKEYENNLSLYIKEFSTQETSRLRSEIQLHTFKGNRYEDLIKKIKTSYDVTARKAKFLAQQETSLLTAKIKETRYADIGIDDYIWQTVVGTANHPVRPMHKKLNGSRQKFSAPPITNPQGQHNNPGEDYRCRCIAKPIVKF